MRPGRLVRNILLLLVLGATWSLSTAQATRGCSRRPRRCSTRAGRHPARTCLKPGGTYPYRVLIDGAPVPIPDHARILAAPPEDQPARIAFSSCPHTDGLNGVLLDAVRARRPAAFLCATATSCRMTWGATAGGSDMSTCVATSSRDGATSSVRCCSMPPGTTTATAARTRPVDVLLREGPAAQPAHLQGKLEQSGVWLSEAGLRGCRRRRIPPHAHRCR